MPKLYIDEFVGISNRLEVLPLAFAIQKAYGHEIVLDWRELDSFKVDGTQRGKVFIRARYKALRIRECTDEIFNGLANQKIILRSLNGPDQHIRPLYLESARKVKISEDVREGIENTFKPHRNRPIVAVHLRRGDFHMQSQQSYDVSTEWPAVPDWWYSHAMRTVLKKQPDTIFFLAGNGDPSKLNNVIQDMPFFTLNLQSKYNAYKGEGHAAVSNPVGDLFALACCSDLIATPVSGYSHWAANALGNPTQCIVPIPNCTSELPEIGLVSLHGHRLPDWRESGRTGKYTHKLSETLEDLKISGQLNTDWLNQQTQ
jgi:hypothetical protein